MFSGGKYEKSNFRDKVVVKEELEKEINDSDSSVAISIVHSKRQSKRHSAERQPVSNDQLKN